MGIDTDIEIHVITHTPLIIIYCPLANILIFIVYTYIHSLYINTRGHLERFIQVKVMTN